MELVDTSQRLAKLRELMQKHEVDVYIVPSQDSHQSEYIAPCDARREHICGFTGSAGTAVVTHDKAAMSTDGRYFLQAEKQLDHNWLLLKQGMKDVPKWENWAAEQAKGGKVVGVDPTVITANEAAKLSKTIKEQGGRELKAVHENLVDQVWGSSRPSRPSEKVEPLGIEFAGTKFEEKIADLRKTLEKKKSSGIIISMLDEIAWLFNLRGSDIPYNPVFFSYALITPTDATVYVDEAKLSDAAKAHLGASVTIKPYESIFDDAHAFGQAVASATPAKKILISNNASWALSLSLGGKELVTSIRSPVCDSKAIKNSTELAGMRACHVRDGAALIEYFAWLEDQLINKHATLDEIVAADKLEAIRSKHQHFAGLSFDTISSTGSNAAVIHYKPERGHCLTIDPKAIYLCDSGAQYLDGTTDTTRTLHFGTPSDFERKAYTLVLKGVIAIDTAIFPKGTSGYAIDAFARQFLWREGLDYRHGTGHGVGSFLNVHEGPIGIGTRPQYTEVALSAGNVISDEPGFYQDGQFGIRIENMIACREVETAHQFGDKAWLGFEHVTMVPMCQNLIDVALLTSAERAWVDGYHAEVWEKTHGFFESDSLTTQWLRRETAPLA